MICRKMRKNTFIRFIFFIYSTILMFYDVRLQNVSITTATNDLAESIAEIYRNQKEQNNYYRCSPAQLVNLIARCPSENIDREVIRKCEKGLFPLDEEDISIIVPTTNRKTNIHYANQYCATCHNDSSTETWDLNASWSGSFWEVRRQTEEEILSTLNFDKGLKRYTVNISGELFPCTFRASKPKNFNATLCLPPIIAECPSTYEGLKDCRKFSGDIVCNEGTPRYVFANEDCARCHNFSTNSLGICHFFITKSAPAQTLFKLRKTSNSNACSIPAVAKYYC